MLFSPTWTFVVSCPPLTGHVLAYLDALHRECQDCEDQCQRHDHEIQAMGPEVRILPAPGRRARCPGLAALLGQIDVMRVGGPSDMGVDVESLAYVVQVKAMIAPVGRPVVQQAFGVAADRAKEPLVFSLGGYTDEAIEWAADAGVGLFEFHLQGIPLPVNRSASQLAASKPSPDGHPSRVAVSSGQEAVAWLRNHRIKGPTTRSKVLLIAGDPFSDEVVSVARAEFPNLVVLDVSPLIPVKPNDILMAIAKTGDGGILVTTRLEELRLPETIDLLVHALTESEVDTVLGRGDTRQVIRVELPEFSVLGTVAEPGLVPGRLREAFDYWLIQL